MGLDILINGKIIDDEEPILPDFLGEGETQYDSISDNTDLSGYVMWECHPEIGWPCEECALNWFVVFDPKTGMSVDGDYRVQGLPQLHGNCVCTISPAELMIQMGIQPRKVGEVFNMVVRNDAVIPKSFGMTSAELLKNWITEKKSRLVDSGFVDAADLIDYNGKHQVPKINTLDGIAEKVMSKYSKEDLISRFGTKDPELVGSVISDGERFTGRYMDAVKMQSMSKADIVKTAMKDISDVNSNRYRIVRSNQVLSHGKKDASTAKPSNFAQQLEKKYNVASPEKQGLIRTLTKEYNYKMESLLRLKEKDLQTLLSRKRNAKHHITAKWQKYGSDFKPSLITDKPKGGVK